jgi:hypothetical protein
LRRLNRGRRKPCHSSDLRLFSRFSACYKIKCMIMCD